MVSNNKVLGFDDKELVKRAIAISGERNRYFLDLVNEYRKRYKSVKLLYANNATGKVVKEEPMPDFILIFKVMSVSSDPTLPSKPIIFVECPLIFSERSLAGWTLAVEQDKMDDYFNWLWTNGTNLPQDKFYEFLESILLSKDPESPQYWMNNANDLTLAKGLMGLSSMYVPKSARSKMAAEAMKKKNTKTE